MADTPYGSGGGGGDGSGTGPMALIDRAQGKSLTQLAKQGIGGWMLAVSASLISGFQAGIDLLILTPVDVMTDVLDASGEAVFEDPLGVVSSGAEATATAISEFGFLALPMGVVLVLASYWIVSRYLQEDETSDLIPGAMTDVIPFVGVEEEGEN